MNLHPKTSGAALGGALGTLIAAILHSISGVHLTPEAYAAIPAFLSTAVAWLVPDKSVPSVTVNNKALDVATQTPPPASPLDPPTK